MDKEQQIKINFLDEAEDYFDNIESVLLSLASEVAEPKKLDLALRAAHSVKGGAGMMGFMTLSRLAHDLEDFFKILRARYCATKIDVEVETLLLQSLDLLRDVSNLHRQGVEIAPNWWDENVQSILSALSEHLGELEDEDELKLLNDNDTVHSTLEMVEEGMENILDEFEQKLPTFTHSELSSELNMVAEQLTALATFVDLDSLVQLCESIQSCAMSVDEETLPSLAQKSLSLWQRSQALIMRRSFDKLPSVIEGFEAPVMANSDTQLFSEDELFVPTDDIDEFNLLDNPSEEKLVELQNSLEQELEKQADSDLDLLLGDPWTSPDLAEIHDIFSDEDLGETTEDLTVLETYLELETKLQSTPLPNQPAEAQSLQEQQSASAVSKTIRVPVEQLYQFNTLFGKLILERNRINLRLEQVRNFVALMRQRMDQLELSNNQLRNWYDRASVEGIIPTTEQAVPVTSEANNGHNSANGFSRTYQGEFDALEMDNYSDLHLISQEQIETIVQLQEVSFDIELGLQEMNQAVQELNQTSRSLRDNVTRTQMLPFSDVSKPFPRLIRDLNVQYDKKVNLQIEGQANLLDRAMVETLNAPLVHLIRNAFDHGIEDAATRLAYQKPPEGTITINAVNRGTQTIITVSDDGGGINLDKLCTRLQEMGMSEQKIKEMSKSELLDYIFQPGFSTAKEVTELSGRGVGMDVVRTALKEIRGDIKVETKAGQGTTFTLTLPYTLSILRVMLVERKGMIVAFPADSVRQVIPLPAKVGSNLEQLQEITWQEQQMPLVRWDETLIFGRPHAPFEITENPVVNKPTALIVGQDHHLGGLQVDRFWSEQEVSIRPIESPIPLPTGFVSSMILGDGRVVPIVDPVQLLEECLMDSSEELMDTSDRDISTSVLAQQGNKILIVDDSINVRRFLALTLEKAGYKVEQAKDGQEAVDKLFAGLPVQAVICDIEMPRLDGYGVLEEIKGKSEFESLPIAMLTSRSNEKHRRLAMNLGASAYFSKPYNEQELLNTISELIHHQSSGNFVLRDS